LNLEEGDLLSVVKIHWRQTTLDRIKRAIEDSKRPTIVFVSLENDEATLAIMRQYGIQNVATINAHMAGKQYEHKEADTFYDEIIDKVKQLCTADVPLIILGPGFAKETLLAEGKEKVPELFGRAHVFHTGQAGMSGIHELMKKGIGAEVLRGSRVAEETEEVERVLEEIAKEGPVAYGTKEVENAVDAGAVEFLIISEIKAREKQLERLMKSVEDARGKVMVVSDYHEAGKKLEAIGGIAALLRFKLG
jgi:protein pelota